VYFARDQWKQSSVNPTKDAVKRADPTQATVPLAADNCGKSKDCNRPACTLHDLFGVPFGGLIAIHKTLRPFKRSLSYRPDALAGSTQRAQIDQAGVRTVCLTPPEDFTGAFDIDFFPLALAISKPREGCAVNHRGDWRSLDLLRETQARVCDIPNDDPQLGNIRCEIDAFQDGSQCRSIARGPNDHRKTFQ
jgi:hypothetical protein